MVVRTYHTGDSAGVEDLWQRNPSAEFPLMGLNPGQVGNLLRRTERWNVRLILALASAVHRPLFKFLILEEQGKVVGTTMMSFPANVAYIGGVTVDAAFRRRGHAQELLRACETLGRRYGRHHLVLDVLTENEPAIRLYERLGYKKIRSIRWMSRDLSRPLNVPAPAQGYTIQPFQSAMAKRLAHLANADIPPSYRLLVSVRPQDLRLSGLGQRIGGVSSATWVLQREEEIVGFVRAGVSPAIQAAQMGPLALAGPPAPEAWTGLIRTALSWCAAQKAPRAILSLPEHLESVLPVLQSEGFTDSFRVQTMALDLTVQ